MKKVLMATLMVGLMLATIFQTGFSADAISIQNEEIKDEEPRNGYKIIVTMFEDSHLPYPPSANGPIKVILRSTTGCIYRTKWSLFAQCSFNVPDGYTYTINTESLFWKLVKVEWQSYDWVVLRMERRPFPPNSINKPFIDYFPLLNLLLQRLIK